MSEEYFYSAEIYVANSGFNKYAFGIAVTNNEMTPTDLMEEIVGELKRKHDQEVDGDLEVKLVAFNKV